MSHEETRNFYNNTAKNTKNIGGYEYNRWFKNRVSKQIYDMTRHEVIKVSKNIIFDNYLEMGCGPGVWTKFFLEDHKGKNFDLVDISEDMIEQAKNCFGQFERIRYFVSDFLDFSSDKKYDFFFSGRAIEYIENKKSAFKKIYSLLAPGGRCFVITKTPKYIRTKIMGRRISRLHQNQISFYELKRILLSEGFSEINFFPATVLVPFFRSTFINKIFARLIKGRQLSLFSSLFTESYCATFRRPDIH